MERTTKKDVEGQFNRLLYLFGKYKAKSYNDIGAWRLDYAPIYGGYVIEEIRSEGGAISHPFECCRRSAGEFVTWAFAITRAIEVYIEADRIGYDKVYKIRKQWNRDKDSRLLPPSRVDILA